MVEEPLVSVVMPAYNSGAYIGQAIQSVLDQTYECWELLIVNDGSTDNTRQVIDQFTDSRIQVYEQENAGVSAARNRALKASKGSFICFLDGDDVLPNNSIASRLEIFRSHPELGIVDGKVIFKDDSLHVVRRVYQPQPSQNIVVDYTSLNGRCFAGISAMIRRPASEVYFDTAMTHGEDLWYYVEIALAGGAFSFTEEEVLLVRTHGQSAMRNLPALEKGYDQLYQRFKGIGLSPGQLRSIRWKISSIMMKSYVKNGDFRNALKVLIKMRKL